MPRVKITEAAFGRLDTGVAVLLDGASVQVDDETGTPATVYSGSTGGGTISNPITSDNGRLPGYLDEGRYSLEVTYQGQTADPVTFEARAAYPSGGTEGQVLTLDANGDAQWEDPDGSSAVLPWNIDINPFLTAATHTNWNTVTQASTNLMGGVLVSSGAQNAEVGWDVVLAAGTWTIATLGTTGTDRGIATVSLDGSSVGTIDWYSGSSVNNVAKTITGINVATTGKKRLLFKMATQNASSSSYLGNLYAVGLRRTA